MQLVKMMHVDTGKTADVHPDEIENYQAGGFQAVPEPEPQVEKPKRGRPKKAAE